MRWVGVVLVLVPALSTAALAGQTAREILDARKTLDETTQHWRNREDRMTITLGSSTLKKNIIVYQRRRDDGGRESLLFFMTPVDARGMGFLTIPRGSGSEANQWLYVPGLRKVNPISGVKRQEAFLGELSYEDLDILQSLPTWTEAEAPSTLLREETVDGVVCHVIELKPNRKDVSYRRILVWLGKDDIVPRKLEFFGDEPTPAKRLVQRDIRQVQSIPVAHAIDVENVQLRSTTSFSTTDVRFNQELEPQMFSAHGLTRGPQQ